MFDPDISLDGERFSARELACAVPIMRMLQQHQVFTFNFENTNTVHIFEIVERNLQATKAGSTHVLCPNRREEDFRQRNSWPCGLYVPDTPNLWKSFQSQLASFSELVAIPDPQRFSENQLIQISKTAPEDVVFAIQDKDEPDNVVRPASDLHTALDPDGDVLTPQQPISSPTP